MQSALTRGWRYQAGEHRKSLEPRGGAGGVGVEGHPFRFSFLDLPAPGVGGELPIITGVGARAGCSPSGTMPHKQGSGVGVEGLVLT